MEILQGRLKKREYCTKMDGTLRFGPDLTNLSEEETVRSDRDFYILLVKSSEIENNFWYLLMDAEDS